MSDPFIGEIRIFGFTYAPYGWAFCNGQMLPVAGNQALYSVIGNYYGGTSNVNFNLPDLRARAALNQGAAPSLSPYSIGSNGGSKTVSLTNSHIPPHTHTAYGDVDASTVTSPTNMLPTSIAGSKSYAPDTSTPLVTMAPAAMQTYGQSPAAAHQNMQPYLPLNFCIALEGEYPGRT